jgi:hypothetical protein
MQSRYLALHALPSRITTAWLFVVYLFLLTQCLPAPIAPSPDPTLHYAILPDTSSGDPPVFNSSESISPSQVSPGRLDRLPKLSDFIAQVMDHERESVRGVYTPGLFALPVMQQPGDNYTFVSQLNDIVTQFGSAAYFDVIGLLAHNYLSGNLFNQLTIGQPVVIVMGDGTTRRYVISEVARFQRVWKPTRLDEFIDVITGKKYSTLQIFNRFYRGDHHLTFQTCVEKDGDQDWGLYFVVAQPEESLRAKTPIQAHQAPR